MKTKSSLFKFFAIVLPLVLTSCNLLPNMSPTTRSKRSSKEKEESSLVDETSAIDPWGDWSKPTSSEETVSSSVTNCSKHSWGDWQVTRPKTCTEDGEQRRTCTVCGEQQTKKITAGHEWGDWQVTQQATCYSYGYQRRVCSACQMYEEREIARTSHQWVNEGYFIEPTCTEAGIERMTCALCGDMQENTVRALGHLYEQDYDGSDLVTWTQEPTCTVDGFGYKTCLRCMHSEEVQTPAFGHNYQAVGDGTTPQTGQAALHVYQCQYCNETYLGFKANEVTEASREHLVFDEDGGARFWGRPIGNAVALDETGSSITQNDDVIYDKYETGDYFEYIFELTRDQVEILGTCLLYVDATPSYWMGNLGLDFWRNNVQITEWTAGYYIDDNPDHYSYDALGDVIMVDELDRDGNPTGNLVPMGARISDYRYLLYVDDMPVDFDPSIEAIVPRGDPRDYYVMPYYFHFHAGLNKIKLVMAGGFRSTFYNFIFKPVA